MKKVIYTAAFLFFGTAAFSTVFGQTTRIKQDAMTVIKLDNTAGSTPKMSDADNLFRSNLEMSSNDMLVKISTETDALGITHDKYQQYYKNLKVEHSTFTAHGKSGDAEMLTGEYRQIVGVNATPSISEQQALSSALNFVGAEKYMWQDAANEAFAKENEARGTYKPKGELVVIEEYYKQTGLMRLAYKFDIYAAAPISRTDIYVDAISGEIVYRNATIKHLNVAGTAATTYSGSRPITADSFNGSYRLRETAHGLGIETYNARRSNSYTAAVDFTDNDNNWTAAEMSTNFDQIALDAHWGATATYDYFKNVHGRSSYDNANAKIKSYVHFDDTPGDGVGFENAYWNGSVMTYGDGASRFRPLAALDVCGHEIAHAVCEKTANLAYQKESGGMNEGFSDIWGAAIEAASTTGKSTWLIGEDIDKQRPSLRSMSNPNAEGQPDTYGGTYWQSVNCTPSNANDQCGVHTNSGVLNYWFYLLSVGASGTNDIGSVFSVSGITIDKAAKIAFRTETTYLSANSTYANARTFAIKSAQDLYGVGSNEEIQTTNAWYAVGVGAKYVAPVTTTCAVPSALAATLVASTTGTLNWGAVSGASTYDVRLKTTASATWTDFLGRTGTSVAITGLVASTAYEFQVRTNCTSGTSAYSASATFSTTSGVVTPTYCASSGSNRTYEWIDLVKLGTINRVSAAETGGYINTGASTNVALGSAQTINFSAGFASTAYTEYWRIYIDYNKDGDFLDAGELVVSTSSSSSATLAASFTIPSTASTGTTRMRVAMSDAATTSCQAFTYGEVEDYTINITTFFAGLTQSSDVISNNDNAELALSLSPNPATDILKFNVNADITSIKLYALNGAEVNEISINTEEKMIDISKMNKGMFLVRMETSKGNISKRFIKE